MMLKYNMRIEFQFRGWGTETGLQPHIEDHYHKQREDLYEAASNRETLSALSLAFTSPRYTFLSLKLFHSIQLFVISKQYLDLIYII